MRGLTRMTGLSLDVKLGARMLSRYPAVTLVGGLAMAIGVGLGAGYLEVVNDFLRPTLPLPGGDRIVGIQNWDAAANDPEPRSLHDFVAWRDQLASVQDLGAYRTIERNLGLAEGAVEPVRGAEISPSAFRVARVPALLGRALLEDDAQQGASPVVVLGHELWRARFAGDAGIVGRTVRLGTLTTTVVGVMPEGFAFPVNHDFWVPLRVTSASAYGPREGPGIQVFGRLAPGVSRTEAQAELSALGVRAAAENPTTHEHLRPRVVRYTELFVGEGGGTAYLVQLVFVMLLLVLSSNVATLMFARTATRENEIVMRYALGGSRSRIIAQFFVEALVLALIATAIGLAFVAWGTGWVTRFFWQVTEGQVPFWLSSGLNATTVLYALALAFVSALVAGVIPALKTTRARVSVRLRHPGGAGASALRFGGLWSAMTVAQVAFAVIIVPPAIVAVAALADTESVYPGFEGDEYLSARLEMEMEQPPADSVASAAFFAEFEAAYEQLRRRLETDPAVSQVTLATQLPGMDHPQPYVELDSAGGAASADAQLVQSAVVDVGFFDAFGAQIVTGRDFNNGDQRTGARAVIVNQHFVDDVLQGRNAIGQRIRYVTRFGERTATGQPRGLSRERMREPGEWYEIVGVVNNLGMDTGKDAFWPGEGPGVYHALMPEAMGAGGAYAVRIAFHVRGDAASYAPELRAAASAVSPALRLYDVLPLDRPVDAVNQSQRLVARFSSWMTALVAVIALLVSIAGIYSMLSFTVARQTRDIGVRIALGADRRRIITGVFSPAMLRIGAGIVIGAVVWFYLIVGVLEGGDRIELLLATAAVLMLLGLLACGVPVRRALRIEPAEALREGE